MERAVELTKLWNWLPAFRAVAETLHLPTAAERVHVTPPALSRTVRLLEDQLGHALFLRTGRRLRLTPAGLELLEATRDGMRRLDDGVAALSSTTFRGQVRISVHSPLSSVFVVPALTTLFAAHPGLIPVVWRRAAVDAQAALRTGELDISFHDGPAQAEQLHTERLGAVSSAVYCGPSHPLFARRALSLEELQSWAFVLPTPGMDTTNSDGWPETLARRAGAYVDQLQDAVSLCLERPLLAVLPDIVVAHERKTGRLRRLNARAPATRGRGAAPRIRNLALFATLRRGIGPPGRESAVLDAVRRRVARALS